MLLTRNGHQEMPSSSTKRWRDEEQTMTKQTSYLKSPTQRLRKTDCLGTVSRKNNWRLKLVYSRQTSGLILIQLKHMFGPHTSRLPHQRNVTVKTLINHKHDDETKQRQSFIHLHTYITLI